MLLSAYHFADFKKKIPATSARPPTELKTTVMVVRNQKIAAKAA